MVAHGTAQYEELFRDALRDDAVVWPDGLDPQPFGPEDRPALRVLLCMGLLRRAPERTGAPLEEVAPLPMSDPVLTLVG